MGIISVFLIVDNRYFYHHILLLNLFLGRRVESPVELIDIFPTLVDLAGLPKLDNCPESIENNDIDLCAEGKSLASFVSTDSEAQESSGNSALVQTMRENGKIKGYSLLSSTYRYQ